MKLFDFFLNRDGDVPVDSIEFSFNRRLGHLTNFANSLNAIQTIGSK